MMERAFTVAADAVAHAAGTAWAALAALALVATWAVNGPPMGFADAITAATFLMTIVVQATQNRDTAATHAKLNALVRAEDKASNDLAGIEAAATEAEIVALDRQARGISDG